MILMDNNDLAREILQLLGLQRGKLRVSLLRNGGVLVEKETVD